MLVTAFENNGRNISKNIVKLNLKQNTNLYCIIIWSTYVQRKYILLIVALFGLEAVGHHQQKGAIKFYIFGFIYQVKGI